MQTIAQIVSFVDERTGERIQKVVAIENASATTEDVAQIVDLLREQRLEFRAISQELERQNKLLSDHADWLQLTNSQFRIDVA